MHEVHRIDAIASAIYDHAFHLLDSEPDTDGMQCGRVATEVEEAFKRAMLKDTFDMPPIRMNE